MKRVVMFCVALVISFSVVANVFAAGPLVPTFFIEAEVINKNDNLFMEANVDNFSNIISLDIVLEMNGRDIYSFLNFPGSIKVWNVPEDLGWHFVIELEGNDGEDTARYLIKGSGQSPLPASVVGGGVPLSYPLLILNFGDFVGDVEINFLKAQVNGVDCFAKGRTVNVIPLSPSPLRAGIWHGFGTDINKENSFSVEFSPGDFIIQDIQVIDINTGEAIQEVSISYSYKWKKGSGILYGFSVLVPNHRNNISIHFQFLPLVNGALKLYFGFSDNDMKFCEWVCEGAPLAAPAKNPPVGDKKLTTWGSIRNKG